MTLSKYLVKRSKDICADNQCTEKTHNCGSYAYINSDMELLDICITDYFQDHRNHMRQSLCRGMEHKQNCGKKWKRN